MHVIVATDGSKQSLAAARHLKSFADPTAITDVTVLAVVRPLAAVAFADELSDTESKASWDTLSFRAAAENAVAVIAAELDSWGPQVHRRVRSGSPANEIIKAAKQYDAGLVVVAAGARGIGEGVLVGSTAQRVQHYAPCPVLVVRPRPRKAKKAKKAKKSKKS